jgi:thermostable 8-oxoguanine DNA glycosylase
MATTMTTTTTKPQAKIQTSEAEAFFASLTDREIKFQTAYWSALKPLNDTERFQRALFAYTSVHTSWKSNIAAYSLIKNWWAWINQWEILDAKLRQSGAGLYNNRVRFIKDFTTKYWSDPCSYHKAEQESWTQYRNRIEKTILGLGMAKSSFFIEMLYPVEAEITCLDTHLFQLYGLDQSKNAKLYQDIEAHWVRMCFEYKVPCYVARCIYWDRKQGYTDSRYWSYVLEEGDFADSIPQY